MSLALKAAIEQIQLKAAELEKKEEELKQREYGLNARQCDLDQLTKNIADRLSSTISDDLKLLHSASRNLGIQDEQNQADEQPKTSAEKCDAAEKLVKDLRQKVEELENLCESAAVSRKAQSAKDAVAAAEAALAEASGDADIEAATEALEREQDEPVAADQGCGQHAGASGEGGVGEAVELERNHSCAARNKDGVSNR